MKLKELNLWRNAADTGMALAIDTDGLSTKTCNILRISIAPLNGTAPESVMVAGGDWAKSAPFTGITEDAYMRSAVHRTEAMDWLTAWMEGRMVFGHGLIKFTEPIVRRVACEAAKCPPGVWLCADTLLLARTIFGGGVRGFFEEATVAKCMDTCRRMAQQDPSTGWSLDDVCRRTEIPGVYDGKGSEHKAGLVRLLALDLLERELPE